MAKLSAIKKFLNEELKVKSIPDASKNGLQVSGKNEVKRIGFAVDGVLSTFEKAKKAKVDLLIVHHGVKWIPQKYKELTNKRLQFLKNFWTRHQNSFKLLVPSKYLYSISFFCHYISTLLSIKIVSILNFSLRTGINALTPTVSVA